ncbi:hypothetical protein TrST_g1351 [Triparma strigata]|uniref:PX domain-containing protein n=1 Tax=Triparma strigata TaxID=1606541 RepID=A0A9W7EXC2_9STRA|nr:hypothetical protein TrST_g1351 [Triparma strigata]
MGNAPPNRITVWQLVPTGDGSRRFSLSSDYMILEHNHVDGRRVIKINDKEMHASRKAIDNGSTHDVSHNGSVYKVTIIATLASFKYECSVNGKKLTSHLERPSAVQEDLVFKVTEVEIETTMGVLDSPTSKSGDSHFNSSRSATKAGEKVAVYTVCVHSKSAGGVIGSSKHRFSDFMELYSTVRSMWGSSHLAKSIPPPPAKELKLATNHYSPEFMEKRRAGLDEFMGKLGNFPGVLTVPGIQEFLGTNSV